MAHPVAGFIGPPGWVDPSPDEFASVAGITAIGVSLDLGPFDWNLDRIATTEPAITDAATELVGRGATAIGIVGTPFGWAGLAAGDGPHDRNGRITSRCGAPVASAVSGMLDWLDDLAAQRVALAATYYDREWCERWERFVTTRGYTVTDCSSMADLDIIEGPLDAIDETHWAPTPRQIERTVTGTTRSVPADAVIVSGAGARTLSCHERLCVAADVPVVSADLGLYRALIRAMGLTSRHRMPTDSEEPTWWPATEPVAR